MKEATDSTSQVIHYTNNTPLKNSSLDLKKKKAASISMSETCRKVKSTENYPKYNKK